MISYFLDNYGFSDSPSMKVNLNLFYEEAPDYTFNITKVAQAVMLYEIPVNSSAFDSYGTLLSMSYQSDTKNITAHIGPVVARSTSKIRFYIERVNKNNTSEDSKTSETQLNYTVAFFSPDGSASFNLNMPSSSNGYLVGETDERKKHHHGGGDDDFAEKETRVGWFLVVLAVILFVVFVSIGLLCYFCCCRKKLTKPPQEQELSQQHAFSPVGTKQVNFEIESRI